VNEIWETLERGEALSNELRASFAVAMTNAHRSCTEAVDLLCKTNGGSSVYSRCPLERCFRDIHTVSQHHFTSVAFDEKAGQVNARPLTGRSDVLIVGLENPRPPKGEADERQGGCDTV